MTRDEARAREGDPWLPNSAKVRLFADANGIELQERALPDFNPDSPKELQRTWEQLLKETTKHLGAAEARRLLGKFEGKAEVRRCTICDGKFTPARASAMYCSSACQRKASRRKARASG